MQVASHTEAPANVAGSVARAACAVLEAPADSMAAPVAAAADPVLMPGNSAEAACGQLMSPAVDPPSAVLAENAVPAAAAQEVVAPSNLATAPPPVVQAELAQASHQALPNPCVSAAVPTEIGNAAATAVVHPECGSNVAQPSASVAAHSQPAPSIAQANVSAPTAAHVDPGPIVAQAVVAAPVAVQVEPVLNVAPAVAAVPAATQVDFAPNPAQVTAAVHVEPVPSVAQAATAPPAEGPVASPTPVPTGTVVSSAPVVIETHSTVHVVAQAAQPVPAQVAAAPVTQASAPSAPAPTRAGHAGASGSDAAPSPAAHISERRPTEKSKRLGGLRDHEALQDDESSSSGSGCEEDADPNERQGGAVQQEHQEKVVEESPRRRFLRFNTKLGSGAHKYVWSAYDTETGKEVAWNVISLQGMESRAKIRISEEIKMLRALKHPRIIAFISAWRSKENNEVVFVTERVTGGSLTSYIRRIGAPIKKKVMRLWARQILQGLEYLHNLEEPVIHRDLKCDNIFINSNVGEVLIGDLGLSTALKRSYANSIVGTPDFIAPEIYEEKYGTAVDIYAFGMCLLEMVVVGAGSQGSPYEECATPGQIYRRVIAGVKPRAVRRIRDEQLRAIVDQCIDKEPSDRPLAADLLKHPWMAEHETDGNTLCELIPVEELPPEDQLQWGPSAVAIQSAALQEPGIFVPTGVNQLDEIQEEGEDDRRQSSQEAQGQRLPSTGSVPPHAETAQAPAPAPRHSGSAVSAPPPVETQAHAPTQVPQAVASPPLENCVPCRTVSAPDGMNLLGSENQHQSGLQRIRTEGQLLGKTVEDRQTELSNPAAPVAEQASVTQPVAQLTAAQNFPAQPSAMPQQAVVPPADVAQPAAIPQQAVVPPVQVAPVQVAPVQPTIAPAAALNQPPAQVPVGTQTATDQVTVAQVGAAEASISAPPPQAVVVTPVPTQAQVTAPTAPVVVNSVVAPAGTAPTPAQVTEVPASAQVGTAAAAPTATFVSSEPAAGAVQDVAATAVNPVAATPAPTITIQAAPAAAVPATTATGVAGHDVGIQAAVAAPVTGIREAGSQEPLASVPSPLPSPNAAAALVPRSPPDARQPEWQNEADTEKQGMEAPEVASSSTQVAPSEISVTLSPDEPETAVTHKTPRLQCVTAKDDPPPLDGDENVTDVGPMHANTLADDTDAFADEELARALECLNGIVIPQVEMVIKKGDYKNTVIFDFDTKNDHPTKILTELKDAGIPGEDAKLEDLLRDIELAILKRCRVLLKQAGGSGAAAQGSHSQASQGSQTADEHRGSGTEAVPLEILQPGKVASVQRDLAYLIPTFNEEDFLQEQDTLGPVTRRAVISFQDYHKLPGEQGTVDERFLIRLQEEVKKKANKETLKRQQREEGLKKSQQAKQQRKQVQNTESAREMEKMMGKILDKAGQQVPQMQVCQTVQAAGQQQAPQQPAPTPPLQGQQQNQSPPPAQQTQQSAVPASRQPAVATSRPSSASSTRSSPQQPANQYAAVAGAAASAAPPGTVMKTPSTPEPEVAKLSPAAQSPGVPTSSPPSSQAATGSAPTGQQQQVQWTMNAQGNWPNMNAQQSAPGNATAPTTPRQVWQSPPPTQSQAANAVGIPKPGPPVRSQSATQPQSYPQQAAATAPQWQQPVPNSQQPQAQPPHTPETEVQVATPATATAIPSAPPTGSGHGFPGAWNQGGPIPTNAATQALPQQSPVASGTQFAAPPATGGAANAVVQPQVLPFTTPAAGQPVGACPSPERAQHQSQQQAPQQLTTPQGAGGQATQGPASAAAASPVQAKEEASTRS